MIFINDYAIDAALSEEHSFENSVTSFPVQDGADITDHIRFVPIQVTIDGIVSDTPIGEMAGIRGLSQLGIGGGPPSEDAFLILLDIRNKREPVTIRTSKRTYENMALLSLRRREDSKTGRALRFQAVFKQVRIVVLDRILIDIPKKANKGHKPVVYTTNLKVGQKLPNGSTVVSVTGGFDQIQGRKPINAGGSEFPPPSGKSDEVGPEFWDNLKSTALNF